MLRAAYRGGRVEVEDAAAGQPVEQHLEGGEVLLDGGGGAGVRFDVGGHRHRLDVAEGQAAGFAPGEEAGDGLGVGGPGVGVADGGGEEFEEAAGGPVARVGDDRRDGQ
jgi:hypothetical protein